jgi:hypothetical protein
MEITYLPFQAVNKILRPNSVSNYHIAAADPSKSRSEKKYNWLEIL